MEKERKLYVEYSITENGSVCAGWAETRSEIKHDSLLYHSETAEQLNSKGVLETKIKETIERFFNNTGKTFWVPNNCPYELHEKGKDRAIHSGVLREEPLRKHYEKDSSFSGVLKKIKQTLLK